MSNHSAGENPDGVLPLDWPLLVPLVDKVLDAEPQERAALIMELCAGDVLRQRRLEQLVVECERDLPMLNGVASVRFDRLATDDEAAALPTIVGERYRIGPEVGRGGMARVYQARDLKHGRDVAIKVVRAELAASLGRDRFMQEIAIAARLRHPNILPLYDSGDANGTLFFVMPFESGPSLRERLKREGPLTVAEALSVLRDVARALQYAHAQGVVHRDIKPDNVLMSGGAAVVADFGIAKAITEARTGTLSTMMTQAGAGIGTPAYMAPEQAVGDPSTDHRADIYSYGCLAYELYTGHPPFHDLPTHLVIAAHVSQTPRALRELRPEVPDGIAQLVAGCLEKDPAKRPQGAEALLTALERPGDVSARRRAPGLGARGSVVTVIAALLGVASVVWWQRSTVGPPISVAVLPYVNIAKDSALQLLADGLSDEVATALDRVPGVEIHSRSGARLYRDSLGANLKDAGRKLNADYVVTGLLRLSSGHWIISSELSRASDEAVLSSETFDSGPEQQLGVALEIATAHAAALRARFPRSLGVAPALAENQQTKNPEAYRLYVLGQELLRRREQSVAKSINAFRQAIALDPQYAGAYAGLSMALVLSTYFEKGVSARAVHDEVLASADQALKLDSTLALPHVARGVAYEHNRQWNSAETEFQTALLRQSDNVEAHIQYGRFLSVEGRHQEALDQFQAARRADPASALILSMVSRTYYLLGRQDSARAISEKALQTGALNLTTRTLGGLVLLRDGRRAEARALVATVTTTPSPNVVYVLAAAGDTAAASARLRGMELEQPKSSVLETSRALFMLAVNDTEQALTALERATNAEEIWYMIQPPGASLFDSVRGSARFERIVSQLGFPAAMADGRAAARRR